CKVLFSSAACFWPSTQAPHCALPACPQALNCTTGPADKPSSKTNAGLRSTPFNRNCALINFALIAPSPRPRGRNVLQTPARTRAGSVLTSSTLLVGQVSREDPPKF